MSPDDYASLINARLVELFIESARLVGMGRGYHNAAKMIKLGIRPERDGRSHEQLRADVRRGGTAILQIEKVLRARNALTEINSLLESDDPLVRTSASFTFGDVDPETAAAADHATATLLTTREMLALRRLARHVPPERPTLQEMDNDALVARFEDAATRQGATQHLDPIDDPEDQAAHNRTVDEVRLVMQELKTRRLLARLVPLLSHRDLTVRGRAAQGCLRVAQQQALAALQYVKANGSFAEAMPARDTLQDWDKGKCLIDGL